MSLIGQMRPGVLGLLGSLGLFFRLIGLIL